MKRLILKILKSLAVGALAVILVALGIDASENYGNMPESVLGRLILGQSDSRCPEEMVFVGTAQGGFCIDRYEASPSDNCDHQAISSQADTSDNLNDVDCRPVSGPGRIPWRYVSQSQAAAACAKSGKRLVAPDEWYLASLGTPDPRAGWQPPDCHVNSNWDRQPGLTGSGGRCVSGAGAYDMVGNVWEWVSGDIRDGEYKGEKLPEEGFITAVDGQGMPLSTSFENPDDNFNRDYFYIKDTDVRALARGGYWNNEADAGVYAMYLVAPTSFAGAGIGFRCAK